MSGPFRVTLAPEAREDLKRLLDHLLNQARDLADFEAALELIDELEVDVVTALTRHPLIYRKASDNPFMRELVLPLRGRGYVALFEVASQDAVIVLAVRHQREDDYH